MLCTHQCSGTTAYRYVYNWWYGDSDSTASDRRSCSAAPDGWFDSRNCRWNLWSSTGSAEALHYRGTHKYDG